MTVTAKTYSCDLDIIQQLKKLGCKKLVLGEYRAIVGQFGFVINWIMPDGKIFQKRWKENEEISITEIIDDNCFISGDSAPSFIAHKEFFKGVIKYSA